MRNAYISPDQLDVVMMRLGRTDRLITRLLAATGYRLDDVMHMRTYQLAGDCVSLRERKTGHNRSVSLPSELADDLRAYAASRHRLSYAFPALRRGGAHKMHRTTYWRHFCAAVAACGYGGCGITPHSIRKLYAVRRLAETRSLEAVRQDLGHTSVAVTALYALSDRITEQICNSI
uniref:Tyr recombinase domain-containing protein n=1 Tax=uncultured prokaryote TaxID=198431 RepID=A0A0H5PZJ7_9ZZZZ|nr:hypothetical protein [uncultured prokaryote]